MKLTKRTIDSLSLPPKDKPYAKIFHDDTLRGFAVRVTSNGVKTFIINRKVKGKVYRMNIGQYGDFTVEQARSRAEVMLGQLSDGRDPKKARTSTLGGITLQQVYDSYIEIRSNKLAEGTLRDYKTIMDTKLDTWVGLPLKEITREMVLKRYAEIGRKSEAQATKTFKLVSALYNFAIYQYKDRGQDTITENPVVALTQTRSWFDKKLRDSKISHKQLPAWFAAVNNLRCVNYTSIEIPVKHYLILLLHTGIRRESAAPIIWYEEATPEEIRNKKVGYLSLEEKKLFIYDKKSDTHYTLPMSDYIHSVFKQYRQINPLRHVFPGSRGKSYIKEPTKVMNKVIKESGVQFMLHDLRRTFATMANEIGVPGYSIKRLLNHKTASSDVTAGYIIDDIESLRGTMNRISDYILEKIAGNTTKK